MTIEDWKIENRGGNILISPPTTVETQVYVDGRKIIVPAKNPAHVLTKANAELLIEMIKAKL